ncbi:hypothetical protein D3C72_1093460 [compost metagenome]
MVCVPIITAGMKEITGDRFGVAFITRICSVAVSRATGLPLSAMLYGNSTGPVKPATGVKV